MLAELVIGGGLFVYLVDLFAQRIRQKRVFKKLLKEVTFELFSGEIVLVSIISDFASLLKNPIGQTTAHKFSLFVLKAILSSGQFLHFKHEFNYFIFNIHFQFDKIDFELKQFMSLADDIKMLNTKLLQDGMRHSMEVYNELQNSKIYNDLKNRYLREWITKIRSEGRLPEGIEVPKEDADIIKAWNSLLRKKAGLPEKEKEVERKPRPI